MNRKKEVSVRRVQVEDMKRKYERCMGREEKKQKVRAVKVLLILEGIYSRIVRTMRLVNRIMGLIVNNPILLF